MVMHEENALLSITTVLIRINLVTTTKILFGKEEKWLSYIHNLKFI